MNNSAIHNHIRLKGCGPMRRPIRNPVAPVALVMLLAFGAGCNRSEDRATAAIMPFADASFELKTVVNPKILGEADFAMADYLGYVDSVVRQQGVLAAALEVTGGTLSEMLTDQGKQEVVAKACDRSKKRLIEYLKTSDKFAGQTIKDGDKQRDAKAVLLEVISQPTSSGDVRGALEKRARLSDEKWSELMAFLKKHLSQDTLDAMEAAQQKYDIRTHCRPIAQ
jgi:hypothetical protein